MARIYSYKTKNGKSTWFLDYSFKGKRCRKKVGTSKKVALLELKDIEVKISKGEYKFEPNQITIIDFFEVYKKYSSVNHAQSTYNRYRAIIDNFITYLDSKNDIVYLSDLHSELFEDFKIFRRTTPLNHREFAKTNTVNMELVTLGTIFNYAIKCNYLKENPTKGVSKFKVTDAMKAYYIGKATYDGYQQGGIWGAIKNYYISNATVAFAGAASGALEGTSAVLASGASSGIYSAGSAVMYGGDVSVNFGFGSLNVSKGGWSWAKANYSGGLLSDIGSTLGVASGYMKGMEDLGKLGFFQGETAFEMKERQLKEGYDKDSGDPDLTKSDLDKIAERTKRGVRDPYKGKFSDNEGNNPGVDAEGDHVNEIRFGGKLHLDRRSKDIWYWHHDEYGSFPNNIMTGVHHFMFESGMDKVIPFYNKAFANEVHQLYMNSQNYQHIF